MKTINTPINKYLPVMLVLEIFLLSIATISFAQPRGKDPVKVKIVKIVDGDTITIEKTMDETNVQDFTKQFQNIKGKNVQVMVTVEDAHKDKKGKHKNECSVMHFNFDLPAGREGRDSASANSFAKCFVFSDSMLYKKIVWNDSLMKNFPEDFDFKFDFDDEKLINDFNLDLDFDTDDDGKTVIIKNGKGKTIIVNEEEDNVTISKSEDENNKSNTKTKTIVISGNREKGKKKVIVTTSVTVIDEDENTNRQLKTDKNDNGFSFYPNPSDGNFILDLEMNGKEDAFIKITDMNGKEVYNEKIAGNGKINKIINLNGKKGTFIVTIKQGNKTTSKKIIIE